MEIIYHVLLYHIMKKNSHRKLEQTHICVGFTVYVLFSKVFLHMLTFEFGFDGNRPTAIFVKYAV